MKYTHVKTLFALLTMMPSCAMAQAASDSTVYKSVNLDSVVVTGKRPLVTRYGTKEIVNVKGSYLSGLGSLGNMLSMTPGLVSKGMNMFEVVGKGVPKYYIDGREVTQQDIFNTIKANNVARIEIEREPSAKYPAGTNAVVNIITLKPMTDYISLNLYNTFSIRRKTSENPSFDFTYSRKKWATNVSYSFGTNGCLNKETYFTEIYRPDYMFRSDEANKYYNRSLSHDVTWTNDFYISKGHRIGLVYNFAHTKDRDINDEQITYASRNATEVKDVMRRDVSQRNLHNVSLSYSGELSNGSTLDLSADYSRISDNSNATSDERSRQTLNRSYIYTRTHGTYDIMTFNGSYGFKLPYEISTEVGGRYYSISHPLQYATNNPFVDEGAAVNSQKLSDNVSAGYFRMQRVWKKFAVVLSGRYEYSDTRITVNSESGKYRAARHTSDFLPDALLQWTAAKSLTLVAGYSRSVGRQGYRGLNPYPSYKDSLAYSAGNAGLLPEYSDRVYIYAYSGPFTFGLSYRNRYNGIENVTYCQSADRDVTTEMPFNIRRSEHYSAILVYRRKFGNLFFSGSAVLTFPHDFCEFRGETYRVTKPYWEGNFNASYSLGSDVSVYSSFSYQSFMRSNLKTQRHADNWSAGIQSELMKKRLTISLSVSDILRHANYNNLSERFLNTRNGTYGTNDMRGVSLSLTYRLFNRNLSTESSSNNSEVIQRTN